MNDCDICGGSGIIRLPVRQTLSMYRDSNVTATLPIREYKCPECGDRIPQENIDIIQAEYFIDTRIEDANYYQHCQQNIAQKIAYALLDSKHISFTLEHATDRYSFRSEQLLKGKLGVISPRFVKTFEERVKKHQTLIAKEVLDAAIKSIRNYGSAYNAPSINKDVAIRFMFECLDKFDN